MPARPVEAGDPIEAQGHPAAGWTFLGARALATPIPDEPRTVRHPDRPVVWRLPFDPPLPSAWQAIDLGFGPLGMVDARLILVLAEGGRLPQPLPKLGRNRFRALFRPVQPLAAVEVELTGSARLDGPERLRMRGVSGWERGWALLRRAVSVLRGDARSLPWRLARVLVQLRRQGRTTIPPTPPAGSPEQQYELWRDRFDERDEEAARLYRPEAGREPDSHPVFTVVAEPHLSPDEAEALELSLLAQTCRAWELFTPRPATTDARVRRLRPAPPDQAAGRGIVPDGAAGRFVLLPRAGTRLRPHALAVFAALSARWPEAQVLYADDDDLVNGVRARPRFKPAWSPTRLAGSDYIGDPCCIAAALLRASRDTAEDSRSLIGRVTEGLPPGAVVHVAQVLSHAAPRPERPPVRPGHRAGSAPRVSLIVPTRDRADLLRLCVDSIRNRTDYPDYEIIIVDNGSREPATLRLFSEWKQDAGVTVLHEPGPFNYSALNNRAVLAATGTLVGLVNNDIEVLQADWLTEMVGWACRPGIGCVGAKLLYPDGRLQHAGVVTGIAGAAGHRCKRGAANAPGMLDELRVVNEVSAVTAACLLVRKAVYLEVGGLDADAFAVAYNDVDFCLRVLQAGYRNLWTPFATLVHHESVSRGRDLSPKTAERFNRETLALRLRWADRLLADPYYSPNLTLDAETGAIRTQ